MRRHLYRSDRDDCVAVRFERSREQELELPALVARELASGAVVTLDPYFSAS